MIDLTDDEIVKLLSNEKTFEKGFRIMVAKYQERIYWHVRRMVIVHEEADDIVQNTFVKAFRGLDKFRGAASLYTWLYRIATNEALNALKKNNRMKTSSIDSDEGNAAVHIKADRYFDGTEAEATILAAIGSLPDKQKAVFNLRYHEEMSYAEMSGVMGTSIGALKASYHHAVKKIEAFVTKHVS